MKKTTALTLWDRIRWPHVAIFAICVFGALGFATFAPDAWSPVERALVGLLGSGGALGWLVNGGLLKGPAEIAPPAEIPPRSAPRRIDREDGSVDAYALLMVAACAVGILQTLRIAWPWVSRLFVVLAIVAPLSGCGGALLAQARAAAVATVALEGGRRVMVDVAEQRSAECDDEACVLAVREDMRPASVAYEGLRLTLSSWVAGLDIARLAGQGEELLGPMLTAGLRFVTDWGTFADALRRVGVELEPLPEVILADVGGAR